MVDVACGVWRVDRKGSLLEIESDREEHEARELERKLRSGSTASDMVLLPEKDESLTCKRNIENPHPKPGPVNCPPTALAIPKMVLWILVSAVNEELPR